MKRVFQLTKRTNEKPLRQKEYNVIIMKNKSVLMDADSETKSGDRERIKDEQI